VIARGLAVVGVGAVLLLAPAAASADGDPASDVLLEQDVFFPYDPPTSNGVARALLELTRRTRKAGWPVKVAIVATPDDLGAVASLFHFQDRYAGLLAKELGDDPRLLVVSPSGFSSRNLGDSVDRTLRGLEPAGEGGDPLARQALRAVSRLAKASGHAVKTPSIDRSAAGRRAYRESIVTHQQPQRAVGAAVPTPASAPDDDRGGGGTAWWLFAGPILVVVAVLIVQNRRERRTNASAPGGEGDG
jgi:hypothetical protein